MALLPYRQVFVKSHPARSGGAIGPFLPSGRRRRAHEAGYRLRIARHDPRSSPDLPWIRERGTASLPGSDVGSLLEFLISPLRSCEASPELRRTASRFTAYTLTHAGRSLLQYLTNRRPRLTMRCGQGFSTPGSTRTIMRFLRTCSGESGGVASGEGTSRPRSRQAWSCGLLWSGYDTLGVQ